MTLRARLAFSLVLIAAVLIVPLIVARQSIQGLHSELKGLRESEFQASLVLGRLRDALGDVRSRERTFGANYTDTTYASVDTALRKARPLADSLIVFKLDSAGRRTTLALSKVAAAVDSEYKLASAKKADIADSLSRTTVDPALGDAERAVVQAERDLRNRTSDRVSKAEDALVNGERVMFAALAIAVLLAAVIGLWLTRFISQPVQALEAGMAAVADGELKHTLNLDATRHDEFGRLATSFEEMTRQLRDLDKLKAEFVSIASHELKTPINVIMGYLQLMQEGVYGALPEKQVPIVKTVETQARTLARLAGQLLDVSRFEAGGGRIEPRPIKLANMLDELERTFHVLAVQKEIGFRVVRREMLPVDVIWDPERINEVTGNLLSNAFKFTTSGEVVLEAAPHENGVCIEVRDSGAGIPPENLPKLFRKFYQADNQKQASAKGTGLGLAIAKEIVEAHQGRISVESKVGVGTTFTIILPVKVVNRRRTGGFRLVAPTLNP
jgi:signal transduction histidine kinase